MKALYTDIRHCDAHDHNYLFEIFVCHCSSNTNYLVYVYIIIYYNYGHGNKLDSSVCATCKTKMQNGICSSSS